MKKTYTACFLFVVGSIFYYGTVKGGAGTVCTRNRAGLTTVSANPACMNSCHTGGVVTDSTGVADTTGTFTGGDPRTGIADVVFTRSISAFPTVATDKVQIVTTEAAKDMVYNVYSMDGHLAMTGTLPEFPALTSVDVHGLAPAQYVIRITDLSHTATFRIIKN